MLLYLLCFQKQDSSTVRNHTKCVDWRFCSDFNARKRSLAQWKLWLIMFWVQHDIRITCYFKMFLSNDDFLLGANQTPDRPQCVQAVVVERNRDNPLTLLGVPRRLSTVTSFDPLGPTRAGLLSSKREWLYLPEDGRGQWPKSHCFLH